jgi:hypothetical protein
MSASSTFGVIKRGGSVHPVGVVDIACDGSVSGEGKAVLSAEKGGW